MYATELKLIFNIVHNSNPLRRWFNRNGPIDRTRTFHGIVKVNPLIIQIVVHIFDDDLDVVKDEQVVAVHGRLITRGDVVPVGAGM